MLTREAGSITAALLTAGAPDAVALVDGDRAVTYGALRRLVAERVAELALPGRAVIVLGASNTLEFVVTYLALLEAGHVPLLAGPTASPGSSCSAG